MLSLTVPIGLLGTASYAALSWPSSVRPLTSPYGQYILFPWLIFVLYRMVFGPPQMSRNVLAFVGILFLHVARTNLFALVLGAATENVMIDNEKHAHFNALVHAGLAYTLCGALNAITLNRRDMDPGSVALLLQGPRMEYSTVPEKRLGQCVKERVSAYVCFALIFYILIRVIEDTTGTVYGLDVSFWAFCQERVRPQDGVLIIYAIGALADVAETIFFLLFRLVLPGHPGLPSADQPLTAFREPYSPLNSRTAIMTFSIAHAFPLSCMADGLSIHVWRWVFWSAMTGVILENH